MDDFKTSLSVEAFCDEPNFRKFSFAHLQLKAELPIGSMEVSDKKKITGKISNRKYLEIVYILNFRHEYK